MDDLLSKSSESSQMKRHQGGEVTHSNSITLPSSFFIDERITSFQSDERVRLIGDLVHFTRCLEAFLGVSKVGPHEHLNERDELLVLMSEWRTLIVSDEVGQKGQYHTSKKTMSSFLRKKRIRWGRMSLFLSFMSMIIIWSIVSGHGSKTFRGWKRNQALTCSIEIGLSG